MKEKKLISIVIPCYNEENNLVPLYGKIKKSLKDEDFEVVFVDDGSADKTLEVIKLLTLKEKKVKFISFSRNFGHQAALKAGIDYARGEAVVSMDADLQHPPELIPKLIKLWREGNDVVITVRNDEKTPFLKKVTSKFFYRLLNKLSGLSIRDGSADFRLLDRKVVAALKELNESVIFFERVN